MQAPQQHYPKTSNQDSHAPSTQHAQHTQLSRVKKITITDMPSVTDTHKQLETQASKPFEWRFLLPQYWGIWLAMSLLLPCVFFPLRGQFWLGRQLGRVFYALAGSRRQVTLVNLKLAFPNKSDDEHQRMAKQVFVNQGIGIFESLSAWYRPNLFTRTVSVSGMQHLLTAQKNNQAVILLGAHYTMLDLGGLLFSQFYPIDCVYRPQNNALFEWLVFNARRKIFGQQIDHNNMRQLIRHIKQGRIIWYTPDQDYGLKQGVMADFFGVPAATLTAQRRLAKMGNKTTPPAVMVLHFYRQTPDNLPRGKRPHYHISVTPALDDYPSDDEAQDAQRINDIFASLICIDPTQWMWFHKRYKTQPDGTDYYQ